MSKLKRERHFISNRSTASEFFAFVFEREFVGFNSAYQVNPRLEIECSFYSKILSNYTGKYENGKDNVFSFNSVKNQVLNAEFALIQNKIKNVFLV